MDPAALRNLFEVMRSGGHFSPADSRFMGADLRGAFLLRANLAGGTFAGTVFDHANLSGARLAGADFSESSLRGAELNGADLTGADLRAADLIEARIEGVCLVNADLRGACLKLIRGQPASVAGMQLDHAAFERSEMTEEALIELWRDGACIDDLERFSERVQHACRSEAPEGAGREPHSRDVALVEAEHRRSLLPRLAPSLRPRAASETASDARPSLRARSGTTLAPGDELLGLRLVEKIGRGSHGSVWKALEPDGRALALKVFDAEDAGEAAAATFQRGVAVLNRAELLDERGVCRLARPYAVALNELAFSYDYYDNGSALGIPALGWSIERVLEFYAQVCRSVAELHALGLTHRSLKPSNVLVDDELRPVLIDAGMVGLPDPGASLTRTDAIYRAPEEFWGESSQSPTADVYGLGRLLWFLLLGRDPDEAYESLATLDSLAHCPAGIVRIVRKATAHDPAERYQWVDELEADLERYTQVDRVGVALGVTASGREPRYGVSSLPVPPPKRDKKQAPPANQRAESPSDGSPTPHVVRALERVAGVAGLAIAVLATAALFAVQAPPPEAARAFGLFTTAALAASTLLLKPLGPRRVLSRLAGFGLALTLLVPLELERIAILRWKLTLEHGSDEARPRVARFLARSGARNLRSARLEGGDLSRADLGRADLRQANLRRANLRGANLSESNLAGADVRGADFREADLLASNIQEARGWSEARCSHLTAMPARLSCVDGHPASMTE